MRPIAPRKLYLAGPMSGYAQHNFPLFNQAARALRGMGYEVFNPAENPGDGRGTRAYYMRLDIPALMACEGVVVLPGWERSRGAGLEIWIALDLDMPIYRYHDSHRGPELEPLEGLELDTLPFERQPGQSPHPTPSPSLAST